MVAIYTDDRTLETQGNARNQVEAKTKENVEAQLGKVKGEIKEVAGTIGDLVSNGTYKSAAEKANTVSATVDAVVDQLGSDLPAQVRDRIASYLKDMIANSLKADHAEASHLGLQRGTKPANLAEPRAASNANSAAQRAIFGDAIQDPLSYLEQQPQSNTLASPKTMPLAAPSPGFNSIKTAIAHELSEVLGEQLSKIKQALDPLRGQQGILARNDLGETPVAKASVHQRLGAGSQDFLHLSLSAQEGSFAEFLKNY